ncbi:MAG TPA: hypothetical protein VKB19_14765 [Pedobacter sp.]|nr:hypothetical protein [Pedobacter sp.]
MTAVLAFTPKQDDPLEKIIAALEKWAGANPQEKVYLHTDRPYYLVGDTIWFKAYVTIGAKHQLSALSGAVYVDLINEKDSLTHSLKLPLTAGMGNGEFILADSTMSDGNYRLRAYTQWMRNMGPDYFYDKVIKIGNSISNPVFASISYEYGKDGKTATAIVQYTDEKGEPYSNKLVTFDLLANSDLLAKGKNQTDAKGEIRIPLRPNEAGKYAGTYLVTKIEAQPKEIISKSFLIKSVSTQSDVQFFPESGNLINGVRTKVAFKAIGTEGTGINIKGIVTDNANTQVAEFETSHLGMGFFQLLPETGKTYQAKVTYPDGSENVIKLPVASDNGYVLSVYNSESDTILVRIRTNEETLKAGAQNLGLVVQSSGAVYFGSEIPVGKATVSIPIPAADFPSGIMQFTLFSAAGVPVNERIIFVQRNDQMKVKLSTKKTSYATREKVEVDLDAQDNTGKPLTGSFSVSVINEAAVPVDEAKENTIFSHLLLSSDIKGYVENPNYYFNNPTEETRTNLDVLMLTQGYRRFIWKDLIAAKPFNMAFKPEKLTSEITGRVLTLGEKPLAGANIIMMSNKVGGAPIDTVSDAQGNFKFSGIFIPRGVGFSLQARGPSGSKKVELKLNMPSVQIQTPNPNIGDIENDTRKLMAAALENSRKQENDLLKRGMLGRTQQLKEVQIRARKRWATTSSNGIYSIPEGHADRTIKPDANEQFKDILEFMMHRLTNVVFNMEESGDCGMMMMPSFRNERLTIFLNGRRLSACENLSFYEGNPSDIIKIDVVTTNRALINMLGAPGLVVTTKFGGYRTSNDFSMKHYTAQGYDASKEFYSPKYKNDDNDPKVADLRSTIYWNPTIISKEGKAKFEFFNADSKGTYRVVVEGLNASGIIGRQVFRYKVE